MGLRGQIAPQQSFSCSCPLWVKRDGADHRVRLRMSARPGSGGRIFSADQCCFSVLAGCSARTSTEPRGAATIAELTLPASLGRIPSSFRKQSHVLGEFQRWEGANSGRWQIQCVKRVLLFRALEFSGCQRVGLSSAGWQ